MGILQGYPLTAKNNWGGRLFHRAIELWRGHPPAPLKR